MKPKIVLQRDVVISEFAKLGFCNMTSFYNVCKSLDVKFSGFEIVAFYYGQKANQKIINRLHAIIEVLKHE